MKIAVNEKTVLDIWGELTFFDQAMWGSYTAFREDFCKERKEAIIYAATIDTLPQ